MKTLDPESNGYFAVSTNEHFLTEVAERLAPPSPHATKIGMQYPMFEGELTPAERERYRWRSLQGLAWRDW